MDTMRAAIHYKFGGPEVLQMTTVAAPRPQADQVLVRVQAASVNGFDIGARAGALKIYTGRRLPMQTGLDFVGEVVTAPTSSAFKTGERVWGVTRLHQLGSVADLVCVAPAQLAHAPSDVEPSQAAALPVVGCTAITALRDLGGLRSGQRLLVRGASGGVGTVAVQLGHTLGAHVTGVASAGNLTFVREIGADDAFDYAKTAPGDLAPFDVILDTVGSSLSAWRGRLKPTGRMMAIVPDLAHPLASMAYIAWSRVHGSRRVRFFSDKPNTALLTDLADYVRQGAIKPFVDRIYPLSNIADAHRAMEANGRRGKQVVQLS